MADMTDGTSSRAQILLVTALVLGIMFVSLALILNSAIFTENLASRGETTGGNHVIQYHSDLNRGVGNVLVYENRNATQGESHTNVADRVEIGVNDANDVLVRQHAKRGALSEVSIDNHTNGSRIYQTNDSRNFTNGDNVADWRVASNVNQTRSFQFNVSQSALSNCSPPGDCFTITVSDGTVVWNVYLSSDSGVNVTVDDGNTENCEPVDEPTVEIDLTAGTVAGKDCPALSFEDAPDSGYNIEFANGDEIGGTYSLVVDNASVATSPIPSHFTSGEDPSVSPALYNVTLGYEYETSDIAIDSQLTVAPGEPDE